MRQPGVCRSAWRWRAAAFGPALMLTLAGCLDLVPVGPPSGRPAALNLHLRLTQPVEVGPPIPIVLRGVLDPGVENAGSDRTVVADALTFAGHELRPIGSGPTGLLEYGRTVAIDPARLRNGTIDVSAPAVGGVGPLGFDFRWPVVERIDPGPIELGPGEDLVLELDLQGLSGTPAPIASRWSVSVFGVGEWSSRGADGPPPATIVVPAEFVAQQGSDLLAVVSITRVFEVAVPGGDYLARVEVGQELRWEVVNSE